MRLLRPKKNRLDKLTVIQQQQQQQQQKPMFGDPPQYHQTQSYQQYQQDYQQQREGFQGEQKSEVEEEVQETYREPPPSYHQHHFKIPSSYHHEDPKGAPPSYPTEDRTSLDVPRTREGTLGLSHSHQEPLDAWGQGLPSQTEPPPSSLQQGIMKDLDDIQPMDVDSHSSNQ